MSFKKGFEEAYIDRWKMDDMSEGKPQALWAAKWMAEKIASESTCTYLSPKEIRQLGKELDQ